MIEQPKTVIFTSGFVEPYTDNQYVIEKLNNMFDTDQWIKVSTHIDDVPKDFIEGSIEDFYNGIAFSQYCEMERGNIYVNSMFIGMMYDSETWVEFLSKQTDIVVYFLEIDYEEYLEFGDTEIVDKEQYDGQNEAITSIVSAINNLNQGIKGIH